MAVGDSITAGSGCTDGNAWRAQVLSLAQAAGKNISFSGPRFSGTVPLALYHDAVPGYKISDLTPTLASYLNSYQPNVVAIFLGSNNAAGGQTTTDATTADYDAMLAVIRAWSPTVKVAAILPIQRPLSASFLAQVITQETAVVNARITAGDTNLVLVSDTYNLMPTDQLNSDQIHPTCDGYVTLGNIIWNGGLGGLVQ